MRYYLGLLGISFFIWAWTIPKHDKIIDYPEQLSAYGFFENDLRNLKPKEHLIPYELKSPLFSDYAHKERYIVLPDGAKVSYNDEQVFDFPVGTKIIKSFYYYHNESKPEKGRRIIETRLLIHEEEGWLALPYVWNDDQTDAYLDVAGDTKEVEWKDHRGKKQKIQYSVPNVNQCKGCHLYKDEIKPIGPTARQLNSSIKMNDVEIVQLKHWQNENLIEGLPAEEAWPQISDYEKDGSLDDRARAYLDINCAHCHNRNGPANTSGLYLDIHEQDPMHLGVNKQPVAAGRGSGGRPYNIVPGEPSKSILLYRMQSEDPGVMMPEISRKMIHKEGVELISEWISSM